MKIQTILKNYIKNIYQLEQRGDAREESYYSTLAEMINTYAQSIDLKNVDITILPKKTEGGNPDFRVWDGKQHIIGYIEAKVPGTDLDKIENTEQLQRYRSTFPNLLLTNFYEFRLYRNGVLTDKCLIARHYISKDLKKVPPLEKTEPIKDLFNKFLSFSMPKLYSARTLAEELAKRTRFLRDEIIKEEMNDSESEINGFYEAFKEYLIPNLEKEDFADLYAQTITYGLFAARMRSGDDFSRKLAYENIPSTIGILKDIFKYISLGDPSKQMEIIIDDIADVLSVADVKEIVRHYSQTQREEDPIVHFYETFLSVYDPEKREKRGVYYTPKPVVFYIVKSLNKILKNIFSINDGFADTNVTILDPAAGTLTFPIETIRNAVNEYIEKYGDGNLEGFIKNHILKNFYAFELMMAPYAIGHLKVGFVLDEFNYQMDDEERFNLYLTNTLEEAELKESRLPGTKALSEESHLAGEVKNKKPILVIMGNPPYSGISSNMGEWIQKLIKEDIDGCQSYYKVDGEPLGEKKLWLQDDYVKFLRFAQWKIEKSGKGVVGMITNHAYLDNPTFRGMRQSLTKIFNRIYILNLHGNSLKRETSPDGTRDENVFDIRAGVSIAIFIKEENKKDCKVYYKDLWGVREYKYEWLFDNDIETTKWQEIKPQSPWYFFVPYDSEGAKQYEKWYKITEIFPINVTGIVTARDNLCIDEDKQSLYIKIKNFRDSNISDEAIKKSYGVRDNYAWKIKEQRGNFRKIKDWEKYFNKISYRPFDERWIYYQENVVFRMRQDVMRHMLAGENLGLITTRFQFKKEIDWTSVFISKNILDINFLQSPGTAILFPLYLYPEKSLLDEGKGEKKPNINEKIYSQLKKTYKKNITPEEILYYIYGILYSNEYRQKFAEYLKIDFPRIPFTTDYKLFKEIGKIGKELVDLHLLKSKLLNKPVVKFMGREGTNMVDKIRYDEENKRVYINQHKYFEGITSDMWNYHIGGYQVLRKYLRDRKGKPLKDPEHYIKMATSIHHTIKLQPSLDELFNQIKETIERE